MDVSLKKVEKKKSKTAGAGAGAAGATGAEAGVMGVWMRCDVVVGLVLRNLLHWYAAESTLVAPTNKLLSPPVP